MVGNVCSVLRLSSAGCLRVSHRVAHEDIMFLAQLHRSAVLQFLVEALPKAEEEEQEEVGHFEGIFCKTVSASAVLIATPLCVWTQVVVGPRAMLNRSITRALKRFLLSLAHARSRYIERKRSHARIHAF